MSYEPAKPPPDEMYIDVSNGDEMEYIAAKFGCTKSDVIVAIETLKVISDLKYILGWWITLLRTVDNNLP